MEEERPSIRKMRTTPLENIFIRLVSNQKNVRECILMKEHSWDKDRHDTRSGALGDEKE
jgi:hypothetical protein